MSSVSPAPWTDNERGPTCLCDGPTVVKMAGDRAILLCLFHTREAGASFSLPPERPTNWPELTIDDVLDMQPEQGKA